MTNQIQDPSIEAQNREAERIFIRQVSEKYFWAGIFAGIPKNPIQHIKTLRLRWDFRNRCGVVLEYNPQFIIQIYRKDPRLLEFYIAHEGAHLLLRHMQRWEKFKEKHEEGTIDATMFHMAADLAVNDLIVRTLMDSHRDDYALYRKDQTLRDSLEPTEYFSSRFGFPSGLSLEGYYTRLDEWKKAGKIIEDKTPSSEKCPTLGPGPRYSPTAISSVKVPTDTPNHIPAGSFAGEHEWDMEQALDELDEAEELGASAFSIQDSLDDKLPQEVREYIERTLDDTLYANATKYEQQVGSMPGNLREHFTKLVATVTPVNWRALLLSMIKKGRPGDEDVCYGRWNRRLIHLRKQGILPLPGQQTTPGWRIVLIKDTSGSMMPEQFAECLGVCKSLLEFDGEMELFVAQADTKIHRVYQVKKETDISMVFEGRGGTDFSEPIREIEHTIAPDLIIYATDGYGSAPTTKPKTPIIWCLTPHHSIPAAYGRVVVMNSGKVLR